MDACYGQPAQSFFLATHFPKERYTAHRKIHEEQNLYIQRPEECRDVQMETKLVEARATIELLRGTVVYTR